MADRHPAGYQRPTPLPVYTLAAVAWWLTRYRLRCGACRARLTVDPPGTCSFAGFCVCEHGRLVCTQCSREYAEIVHRHPTKRTTGEDRPPKRGRPPKGVPA